jgi:hypothetical protein
MPSRTARANTAHRTSRPVSEREPAGDAVAGLWGHCLRGATGEGLADPVPELVPAGVVEPPQPLTVGGQRSVLGSGLPLGRLDHRVRLAVPQPQLVGSRPVAAQHAAPGTAGRRVRQPQRRSRDPSSPTAFPLRVGEQLRGGCEGQPRLVAGSDGGLVHRAPPGLLGSAGRSRGVGIECERAQPKPRLHVDSPIVAAPDPARQWGGVSRSGASCPARWGPRGVEAAPPTSGRARVRPRPRPARRGTDHGPAARAAPLLSPAGS